ncbi:ATP-binding protein [Streptomyces europaeiscabiei]|uniref:ATP-binding protein n=1 Tax=Streptomyces europaeiscabiei TaxID=146819 RepID=A0AAJ2PS89_9ACTN|nr:MULTISPECIES: ATP-binding protein [Streptomyces]MDX3132414.1 ATP-binding protein [Streptomyces europaeiscabiei]
MTTTAARPASNGAPGYSETMPCEPASARRARLLVSAALNAWGIGDLADSATLIVSELVGNSVQHTPRHLLRVIVSRPSPDRVQIAVIDKARTVPAITSPADDAEKGRGLFLVDVLSDRWGYDLHRWGKTVWAELKASSAVAAAASRG